MTEFEERLATRRRLVQEKKDGQEAFSQLPATKLAVEMSLRRRAREMRGHIAELAVYHNWPVEEVQRCYRALDRLDFEALDTVLSRLDPP